MGIPDNVPVFLFVGSGFDRKGLAILLHALSQLPSARLIIVGKDKHGARYRALAEQLGVSQRIHWAGAVTDPAAWYGLGHALVLPTVYDPFPNVVPEAMASGLPVITSNSCGGAELIKEGNNGFVIKHDDVPSLVRAMTVLLDMARAKEMGKASRESVSGHSLAAMAGQLQELYSRLLHEGNVATGP